MRALALIDRELHAEYFRRATLMSERDVEMATQVLVGDRLERGRRDGDGEVEKQVLFAELGKARGGKTVARCDLMSTCRALLDHHEDPGSVVKARFWG